MYPVRVASSVTKQTDEDLRKIAEEIQVPVAHIIRIGIEKEVALLKQGVEVVNFRKQLLDTGVIVHSMVEGDSYSRIDNLMKAVLNEVGLVMRRDQ